MFKIPGEMLALSTATSLELIELESIGIAINWAKKDPNLFFLGIYDQKHKPIAVFNPRNETPNLANLLKTNIFIKGEEKIFFSTPVKYKNHDHGKNSIGILVGIIFQKPFRISVENIVHNINYIFFGFDCFNHF